MGTLNRSASGSLALFLLLLLSMFLTGWFDPPASVPSVPAQVWPAGR